MIKKKLKSFPSEEKLVAGFIKFLKKTNNGSFQIVRELEGGFGRPDVVLYNFPPKSAKADIHSLANLNPRFAPLLSVEAGRLVQSLSTLATISGTSPIGARRIANELAGIKRLAMVDEAHQTFEIASINSPPFSQVVAIEAKLRDWRRAVVQAYRYLQFSTEAWVLLDHSSAGSAIKESNVFHSCGVGLASFSSTGELHIHVRAANRSWLGGALAWRTQAMLARVVGVR